MNRKLKHYLIIQSLSPAFFILIVRHFRCEYSYHICRCFDELNSSLLGTISKIYNHELFGEFAIFIISLIWVIFSLLFNSAFKDTQTLGFNSHGEQILSAESKKDGAASFLMTFILPLLVDDLSSKQMFISYIVVICVVYAVLYQSNLYYQSPVLALLKYHIYEFEISNPYEFETNGFKKDKKYIGITHGNGISDEAVIKWKYIADDVYLIYNE